MEQNNHIHKFEEIVVPPTCKEKGYTLHKCECGYEHKDNFKPITDHKFEIAQQTMPTCTENGNRTYRCIYCGETKEVALAPLGHAWGNWNISTYPTCTKDGAKMRICGRCGTRVDDVIPALGHKLTSPKKSQTQKGYIEYFCENCGETVVIPASVSKFKKFLSSHKKGVIASVISLVVVISLVFATFSFLIPAYHYYNAKDYIEQKDYIKAYSELKKCGDFKDSYALLNNFYIEYSKTESFNYSDGELGDSYTYERKFDEYGNKIYEAQYSENGILDKQYYDYEFYKDGIVKKKTYTFCNAEGVILDKAMFEYDIHGNKTHEIDYDEYDNIEYEYKYENKYNKDNVLIEKTTYYNGIKTSHYQFNESEYIISYIDYDEFGNIDKENSYKYEFDYDDEGRVIHGISHYENGEFHNEFENDYYSNDNLKLSISYNEQGVIICKNEYYSNGNVKLIVEYNDDGQVKYKRECNEKGDLTSYFSKGTFDNEFYFNGDKFKYEYDSNGNVIKEINNHFNLSDDEIEESESKIKYKYDENGILKSSIEYDDNGEKSREVHYYDPVVVYNLDNYNYDYRYDY